MSRVMSIRIIFLVLGFLGYLLCYILAIIFDSPAALSVFLLVGIVILFIFTSIAVDYKEAKE